MKKYNLSEIMKRAWALYRQFQNFKTKLSFSECLKKTWKAAKEAVTKTVEITLATIKNAAQQLVISGEYETISYREWSNYGKTRIYIKAIRHTLAGNVRIADCGYWDCNNNKYVAQAINLTA